MRSQTEEVTAADVKEGYFGFRVLKVLVLSWGPRHHEASGRHAYAASNVMTISGTNERRSLWKKILTMFMFVNHF